MRSSSVAVHGKLRPETSLRESVTHSYWRAMVGSAFEYEPERPPNRDTARAAAIELRAQGLTVADISAALKASEGAIWQLLGMAEEVA